MKRINYTAIARKLTADLDKLSARRSARRLDADDVAGVIDAIKKLRRIEPGADYWRVTDCGGYVPNSYDYRADADHIEVVVEAASGDVTARAWRGVTQSRRGGEGNTLLGRADGRLVLRR